MHSCLDTNVRNYFVTEKWLKQGVRSQKKGKERFLLPKWPEMLPFIFEEFSSQEFYCSRSIYYLRNSVGVIPVTFLNRRLKWCG